MYTKDDLLIKSIEYYIQIDCDYSTMNELAAQIKVSKVTLYNNFGSKKNLQNEIIRFVLQKTKCRLEELITVKRTVFKKVISFIAIMTDFYSSNEYEVIESLSTKSKTASIEHTKFEESYKSVLLTIIKEGQDKKIIKENIDPTYLFYLVDMGLKYFSHNQEYKNDIKNNLDLSNFITDAFTSSIFKDKHSIIEYSKNKKEQQNDKIINYYSELANLGTKQSVDTMMEDLNKSRTVVETRFIDFGLSLVEKEEGFNHIRWYLFNGTQIQRNYATLYFVRQGRYDFIKEALDLGLIDETQAFSR